ncbi:hypothetical protein [Paraburkholderia caffeinilytica]|uniref:hypothetical protein n=1 Tax=Paraburkholderia caffeinilytica TaxID=1761016 RepID=UPI003DA1054B
MRVRGRSFSLLLVAGLLMRFGALFCPAGDWKMATIAENVFIRRAGGIWGFYVVVKWGNVLFFVFMQGDGVFAVFWRYVEECDLGPAGLGVVGVLFYLVLFVFIWVYLGFGLYLFGLLVFLFGLPAWFMD